MTNPAPMGSSPSTDWAYVGMNTIGATISSPNTAIARFTAAMVRRRHTQPGRMGSAARRSTPTTTAASTALAPSSPSEGADSQGQATPPWTSAKSSTPPQANTASAPAQSTGPRRPGDRTGSTRWRATIHRASAASGRLSRKIQRQCAYAASSPPTAGPATEEAAHTVDMRAWIRGRSLRG